MQPPSEEEHVLQLCLLSGSILGLLAQAHEPQSHMRLRWRGFPLYSCFAFPLVKYFLHTVPLLFLFVVVCFALHFACLEFCFNKENIENQFQNWKIYSSLQFHPPTPPPACLPSLPPCMLTMQLDAWNKHGKKSILNALHMITSTFLVHSFMDGHNEFMGIGQLLHAKYLWRSSKASERNWEISYSISPTLETKPGRFKLQIPERNSEKETLEASLHVMHKLPFSH